MPENQLDTPRQSRQPETAEAIFVPPELSPQHVLLRPEHQRAMPPIEMIGSLCEETSLHRIIKSMTTLYVEGHLLLQQARELDIGAEILARQAAGHCVANHDRYHELNGGTPPRKGFSNWLLWYVAAVLAPGSSIQILNFTPGGAFIEGVIWDWMADDDTTVDIHGTKLQKCPEKARVFEAICKLFRPLTDIAYECPNQRIGEISLVFTLSALEPNTCCA